MTQEMAEVACSFCEPMDERDLPGSVHRPCPTQLASMSNFSEDLAVWRIGNAMLGGEGLLMSSISGHSAEPTGKHQPTRAGLGLLGTGGVGRTLLADISRGRGAHSVAFSQQVAVRRRWSAG